MQKISRQHYMLVAFTPSFLYVWNKIFWRNLQTVVSLNKLLMLKWCFTKQWFTHLMIIPTLTLLLESCKENMLALYTFIIYLHYILWLSIDLIKENSFRLKKDNQQQLWQTQIMQMIYCFSQIHLPKLNPCLIASSGRRHWMQMKWSSGILIKKKHLHLKWQASEISTPVHIPQ